MRSGWFVMPGLQEGIVTLDDQMIAIWPAVKECAGKSVLDIGCAEGLIGREFARAGASGVIGLESVAEHLKVAWDQCAGFPMQFVHINIGDSQPEYSADIVLCLNVAHKLRDPAVCIRFAAHSSRDLVLIRSGRGSDANGIIKSKHYGITCDSHAIMIEHGFLLERIVDGPKGRPEPVEYWRKKSDTAMK